MPRPGRRLFAKRLPALALQNAHALESKARAASSLARTYPENGEAFREIETAALRQLFRIIVGASQTEPETGADNRDAQPSVRIA